MKLKDFAVIAGLDRYSDYQHLQGAGNDAKRFHDWLINPNGGGMHATKKNIYKIPVPDGTRWRSTNPKPIATDMESTFSRLLEEAIAGTRPIGSRLFIFLAGHGFNDATELDEVALHSAESKWANPKYVAATWYAREFRRIRAFEQIALITDCCRTASVMLPISRPQALHIGTDPLASQVKMFFAHATGFGTPAREHENAGQPAGIFTTALLEALTNAPPNKLGRLTGSSVKNYVHNHMAPGQTADIQVDTTKDFVFCESHESKIPPSGFLVRNYQGGEIVVITDGSRNEVYREAATQPRFEVLLMPGLYKIAIEGSSRSALIEIPGHDDIEI